MNKNQTNIRYLVRREGFYAHIGDLVKWVNKGEGEAVRKQHIIDELERLVLEDIFERDNKNPSKAR